MGHSSSVAVAVGDVEYPVSWVEVPYESAAQEAQAPTIAYGARGAREAERRVKSVTFLAEELAHASLEDVLKPDVFTVDDTGSSAWLACRTSCWTRPAEWSAGRGSRRSSGTRAASVVGIASMH